MLAASSAADEEIGEEAEEAAQAEPSCAEEALVAAAENGDALICCGEG